MIFQFIEPENCNVFQCFELCTIASFYRNYTRYIRIQMSVKLTSFTLSILMHWFEGVLLNKYISYMQ